MKTDVPTPIPFGTDNSDPVASDIYTIRAQLVQLERWRSAGNFKAANSTVADLVLTIDQIRRRMESESDRRCRTKLQQLRSLRKADRLKLYRNSAEIE